MDASLQQQKRVNEILSRAVDKHSFAERALRTEFDKIKGECDALNLQIKALRAAKGISAFETATSSVASITPPDSSSDKSTKGDT